ncbi:hypothetical protein [Rouxiella sp. Mn2063]|uniref:hypothetical protein n=1 Tax=Rouxiella sp. Mn2063 TaxID=3395262 RepID=UPI003BDDDBFF
MMNKIVTPFSQCFRLICLSLLVLSSLANAHEYQWLGKYASPDAVVNIFDEKDITLDLKSLLGNKYNDFLDNYEGFADPKRLPGGGLLVEGWLRDLRLENASALVMTKDGRLYAGWVTPDANKIMYATNDKQMKSIHPEIKQWAARFTGMSFSADENQQVFTDVINKVNYFTTPQYQIRVSLICTDRFSICNKAVYKGKRKSDGASMILMGKVIREKCDKTACPASSYEFENKETKTKYQLTVGNPTLTVLVNDKVAMAEKGSWSTTP